MKLELETEKMIAEIEGGIGWMTFNNPARHNALAVEMQLAIPEILERFAASDEVRVAVMKGAGDKAFVSGADISEFEKKRSTPEDQAIYEKLGTGSRVNLGNFEKPLIAMIHGYCMGGGLATALAADLRIASEDAQFAIPAARLGVGYPFAGIKALTDLVGPAYANEILFTARRFTADEALRIGLVNRVVSRAELEPTVRELADQIAANAPLTVRASKVAIRQAMRDPEKRDLELCSRLVQDCFESQDFVEGRRAFMEKRVPSFAGR